MSENFDKEQLHLYGIYDLRRILRSLGGTPGVKPKGVIIDEIKNILETGNMPVRSTRGRKAVKSTSDIPPQETKKESLPSLPEEKEELSENTNDYIMPEDGAESEEFKQQPAPYGFGGQGFGETPAYTDEKDKGFTASGAIFSNGTDPVSPEESYCEDDGKTSQNKNDEHSRSYKTEQYAGRDRQQGGNRQPRTGVFIGNSQTNRDGRGNTFYRDADRQRQNGQREGFNRGNRTPYERKDYQTSSGARFADNEQQKKPDTVSGVLEMHMDGYGFLRANNYESSPTGDTFLARQQVKYFGLRRGDFVVGRAERTRETGSSSLTEVLSVNGLPPRTPRRNFDDLTPCYPQERLSLERKDDENCFTLRMMDLLCPLGKGQRGLVVAPPKTGKTTLLKNVAQAIEANHPDIHLIVLLIDERPEEVTDLKSSIKGEVVYSTFDEPPEHHIRAAELVMWRAKRLVELEKDVVILLDSITRLTRAYNQVVPSSGKILSGGIDPAALQLPKKFFGAARNIKEGGSLTILATALIDTGSKMDDVIYEEFKGTGNMEIHLTRELAEKRIFPAFDLYRSGTRKEELLLSKKELDCSFLVRRFISREEGVESLISMIGRTENNEEFVAKFPAWVKLMEK